MTLLFCLALFPQQDLPEQVDRFLKEPDSEKRRAIAQSLRDAPIEAIDKAIRVGGKWPAVERAGTVVTRESKTDFKETPFRYSLWIPEKYDPSRAHRLLITLHGTHGDGDGMLRLWDPQTRGEGDLLVLAPESREASWAGPRLGHSIVLTALREVMRDYHVDPNRVYLDGFSMGGIGSFMLAAYYPDRFAAIAPRGNAPRLYYREDAEKSRSYFARMADNYRTVPIYWVYGVLEPFMTHVPALRRQFEAAKVEVVYAQHDGGHEWIEAENPKVLEWMRPRARTPYPDELHFATIEEIFNRSYWIRIDRTEKVPAKECVHMSQNDKPLDRRWEFVEEVQVHATLDKQANRIDVRTERVKELTVFLHDRMLDLSRPVEIRLNGKTVWNRKAQPSVQHMLDSAYERDRELFFSAEAKLKVP